MPFCVVFLFCFFNVPLIFLSLFFQATLMMILMIIMEATGWDLEAVGVAVHEGACQEV